MKKSMQRLYPHEAELLGLEIKENEVGRKQARYFISNKDYKSIKEFRKEDLKLESKTNPNDYKENKPFVLSAWNEEKGEMLSLEEFCVKYKIDFSKVTSAKFLPYHYAKPTYHVVTSEYKKDVKDSIDFEKQFEKTIKKQVKKHVNPIKFTPKKIDTDCLFDVAIYTDVHIGMTPNPKGFSLYGGKWNGNELDIRKNIFVERILKTKKSNKLIMFDLGDLMDGLDGETVRKGHKLPQNMTDEEAFDIALDFKISKIDLLFNEYEEIELICITDDNHSGSFSYFVNSSFKRFIERKYKNVKVIIQRKFIDHYIYGNKCFVSTHGKDGKDLKFGFKPKLDPAQIEKINDYLTEYDLIRKDLQVIFIKGDSHQDLLDNTSAQNFYYWNMPAFSPSSSWVQTNYKKGKSGFYTFNFEKDCYHSHPYYFKWK